MSEENTTANAEAGGEVNQSPDQRKAAQKESLSSLKASINQAVGTVKSGWEVVSKAAHKSFEHYLTYDDSEGIRLLYQRMYDVVQYDSSILNAFKKAAIACVAVRISKDGDASTDDVTKFQAKKHHKTWNDLTLSGKNLAPVAEAMAILDKEGLKHWTTTKKKATKTGEKTADGEALAANIYEATTNACAAGLTKCAEMDANEPRIALCLVKMQQILAEIEALEKEMAARVAEGVATNSGLLNKQAA